MVSALTLEMHAEMRASIYVLLQLCLSCFNQN